MEKIYHYIVFEQNDFFKNQVLEELLRERANYYVSKNKEQDFWILLNPKILKTTNILEKIKKTQYWKNNKKLKGDKDLTKYVFLTSTDVEFVKWIKLRIGYFEEIENPLLKYDLNSNGIYLSNVFLDTKRNFLLEHNPFSISSEILAEQLESVVFN